MISGGVQEAPRRVQSNQDRLRAAIPGAIEAVENVVFNHRVDHPATVITITGPRVGRLREDRATPKRFPQRQFFGTFEGL
jgi:hypothetical protein